MPRGAIDVWSGKLPEPLLGDDERGLRIDDMVYESAMPPGPGDMEWIETTLAFIREGVTHRQRVSWLQVENLPAFAAWMDELAKMAEAQSHERWPTHRHAFWTEDLAVDFEAVSWGRGRARIRIHWPSDATGIPPEWESGESADAGVFLLDATPQQLRAFADDIRRHADLLPRRFPGEAPQSWTWLILAALIILLVLALVGGIVAVRWILGL